MCSNESRDLIKSAVNASADQDEIIFCNNPSDRLAHLFTNQMVNAPKDPIGSDLSSSTSSNNVGDTAHKSNVVLFVSHIEPLNNIRSWIDAGVQIERIKTNRDGFIDLVDLEKRLNKYAETNSKLIGLFSGVSRLTGILSDDVATTILLHQYNAISIWDCSASASSAPNQRQSGSSRRLKRRALLQLQQDDRRPAVASRADHQKISDRELHFDPERNGRHSEHSAMRPGDATEGSFRNSHHDEE